MRGIWLNVVVGLVQLMAIVLVPDWPWTWINVATLMANGGIIGWLATPRLNRWLFHMKEPCGLCGHTRKHDDVLRSSCHACWKDYRGVCTKEGMDEHRRAQTGSQGSAGAPASPNLPNSYPALVSPLAGAGQGRLMVPTPGQMQGYAQLIASLAIPPQAIAEAEWDGETVYRGWRAFLLMPIPARGVFRLCSPMTETVWESGQLDAVCNHEPAVPHDMPGCSHGIYLFNDRELAHRQVLSEQENAIIGECVGWGTVIEHQAGYRVEHCRIEGLWTLGGEPELCERLSAIYGVPARNLWDAIGSLP